MDNKNYFQQQTPKLRTEAVLKSLFCALSLGFVALFVAAFATWFAPFNGLWLSLGVFVGVTAITFPLFYLKRFYPSVVRNARRLDSLGLEERLVTMVEFENDTNARSPRHRVRCDGGRCSPIIPTYSFYPHQFCRRTYRASYATFH